MGMEGMGRSDNITRKVYEVDIGGWSPGYMVREECKREKMRNKIESKAVRYEERLEKGGGRKLARKC